MKQKKIFSFIKRNKYKLSIITLITLLLLLLLLLFIKYKKRTYVDIENLISNIKLISNNETNNDDYRVADVIYRRGWAPNYDEWKKTCDSIMNNEKLKDTFLYIYLTKYQSCDEENIIAKDEKKLSNIIDNIFDELKTRNPNKYLTPGNDEIVVQLRLGDMIDKTENFLKKDYVQLINEYVSKYNINKITFVCAFFFGNNVTSTNNNFFNYSDDKLKRNKKEVRKLLNKIHTAFPNIKLNIYSNYEPDLDLYYLYKAKYLITDVGGFSVLIQTVHNNLKGL
jgi:hypothetical protein